LVIFSLDKEETYNVEKHFQDDHIGILYMFSQKQVLYLNNYISWFIILILIPINIKSSDVILSKDTIYEQIIINLIYKQIHYIYQ